MDRGRLPVGSVIMLHIKVIYGLGEVIHPNIHPVIHLFVEKVLLPYIGARILTQPGYFN